MPPDLGTRFIEIQYPVTVVRHQEIQPRLKLLALRSIAPVPDVFQAAANLPQGSPTIPCALR
jgi:hypothetical protein